ncbi:AroM family protein [Amphibacillus jilinensis]|uniref:AroM family protein n=1 Tax=Amphibacillus jilinensis TaxID=1216008 RepID=UPI0002DE9405|nr:AroM family protein [Amphibacillus jilinensis]
MQNQVGIITIGQSPRRDLFPEITRFFNNHVAFIQRGVLDQCTVQTLASIKPLPNENTLVSKLNDGTQVKMAKTRILPIIQTLIDQFNHHDNVSLIILACTGYFKPFNSDLPIIYPDYLLNHVTKGLLRDTDHIGVIVPLIEQSDAIKEKWQLAGFNVTAVACSPYHYSEQQLVEATKQLDQTDISVIVLDCIGYTQIMKETVQRYTSKPVVLSRNVVFSNAAELL